VRAVLAHQHEVASLFVEMRNPRGQTEGGAGKWAIVYGRHIVAYHQPAHKRPVALSIRRGLIVATATRDSRSTGTQRADVRPFDAHRSAKLDELIQKLDDTPPRLRARLHRLHKRWLERQVPASYGRTGR